MFDPKPKHKFTFGLRTVGVMRRDPFGEPVRALKRQRTGFIAPVA